MSFFDKFPAMERADLRDLKKGIDSSFKEFSRSWGEGIEAFFDPLFYFLVNFEKLLAGHAVANYHRDSCSFKLFRFQELEAISRSRSFIFSNWLSWNVE